MIKKILNVYKVQLVISATIAIVLLAQGVLRAPFHIGAVILGSFLGALVLDSEYFIYAFVLEPGKEFSKNVTAFIKHGKYAEAFDYFDSHREHIKDKTLNSAFFQVIMVPVIIFVTYYEGIYFVKALTFSVYANLLYKLAEHYYSNSLDEWFWFFKHSFDKKSTTIYGAVMTAVLVFCISIFR